MNVLGNGKLSIIGDLRAFSSVMFVYKEVWEGKFGVLLFCCLDVSVIEYLPGSFSFAYPTH